MIEQLADDGIRHVERTVVLRSSSWTEDGFERSATLTLVSAHRLDLTLRIRAIPGPAAGVGLYWFGPVEGQCSLELCNEGAAVLAGLLERAAAAVGRGEAFGINGAPDVILLTGNGHLLRACALFDPADPALVLRIHGRPTRQMILLPAEAQQLGERLAQLAGRTSGEEAA